MSEPSTAPNSSKIFRAAIWVAIGALIAAAIVCVVWVLVGDSNGMVARAFLTILLLAAFAGVSILEASLAERRPAWFALASIVSWVVALIAGAFMIWMPEAPGDYGVGAERFFKFILIVLILQAALLHIRLYSKSFARHQTTFTSIVAYVTMGLVVILAVMLIIPLLFAEFTDFRDIYWKVVVSVTILAAVGTALVPLVNALFAPKRDRSPVSGYGSQGYTAQPYGSVAQLDPALTAPAAPVQAWPTYADGRTPLPVMPDGSPDWNAYYTGQPSYPQQPYGATASQAPPAPESVPADAPAVPPAPPVPGDASQPDQPAPPVPPAPSAPDVPPPPRY
ncbi:hypothetical protein Q9S78_05095 [Microbacterium sp. KSW-18]|uniref:Agglutinin receptor n=1 Tax=Microbacterium aquilitoris TaxID=3067307 RepID=A0ABU3GH64_9MICO|nr:hypothetical protein [Microbacterium sp. KSW-18]MDT3330041.1 hypothetical protein [Microbacterium sp. KSW-18]